LNKHAARLLDALYQWWSLILGALLAMFIVGGVIALVIVQDKRADEQFARERAEMLASTPRCEREEVRPCKRTFCSTPSTIYPPMRWPRLEPIHSCNGYTTVDSTCTVCAQWRLTDGGVINE